MQEQSNLPQESEVLRIIADLALLLISVTVPTYAISASFLGKETGRTVLRIKHKREETERKVATQAKGIEEMRAEIRSYVLEEKTLKDRLERISLRGVVGYPALFYGSALLLASAGIYYYPNALVLSPGGDPIPTVWFSVLAVIIGSGFLGRALVAIESVAREAEMVPPAGKIEAEAKPAAEMARSVSAHYFVDTAPGIQKLVVDWRRKVAYHFDARIDQAVREGKIAAFAEPSTNQISWTKGGIHPSA